MPYQFSDTLLLRLPFYPLNKYADGPASSLQDPVFRAAVYLASPVFYSRLASAGFTWEKLTSKEQTTLFKYFNRACYRPTPFGLFATVSKVNWNKHTQLTFMENRSLQCHLEAGQEYVQSVATWFSLESRLQPNPTIYRVMKEYRFVSTDVSTDGKRTYQLQSTDFSLVLKSLLQYCQPGRTAAELIGRITALAQTDLAESEDYLMFLRNARVLVPVLRNQLTGSGYLDNLPQDNSQNSYGTGSRPIVAFKQIIPAEAIAVASLKAFEIQLNEAFSGARLPEPKTRVTSFRTLEQDTLDASYKSVIRDGLFALEVLAAPDKNPAMAHFAKTFRRQFENQRMPLLQALDPESGIAYEEPGRDLLNPLLETLQVAPKTANLGLIRWSPVHACLMECWLDAQRTGRTVISLNEENLEALKKPDSPSAHGISVLFRTHHDKLFIESAGGGNLLALGGRFTQNPEIYNPLKEMAEQIEAQNPQVIFAEILHLSDPHIDNINIRQTLWSYELPITAAPSLPSGRQIQLKDLVVIVDREIVYLWSVSHQKFVVPRLTTAYNHHLNQLPLFRFLADLAYQYGKSNYSFSLRSFFPDISIYPRVEYKKAILSAATWVLKDAAIQELIKSKADGSGITTKAWLQKRNFPDTFVLGDSDQQLVFNSASAVDMDHFIEVITNQKEIILSEWLNGGNQAISDAGNYFAGQFNAFVLPDKGLDLPSVDQAPIETPKSKRRFIPGSEWLYLKLYVPKRNSNKLLLLIAPLLRREYRHGSIRQWFFVRYEDHAPHIRLRLKVVPEGLNEIMQAFKKRLDGHIQEHLIREYQLDVYTRELERYAAGGIELTEQLFHSGSELVLQYLRTGTKKQGLPVYLAAALTLEMMARILMPDDDARKSFFHRAYLDMSREFAGNHVKYQLDRKYREVSAKLSTAIQDAGYLDQFELDGCIMELTAQLRLLNQRLSAEEPARSDYLRSLFHMQLNRFFAEEARLQEMVTYYLLYKYLAAAEGRKKRSVV